MPGFFAYAGTLTFDSNMELDTKRDRLANFHNFMGHHLPYYKSKKSEYYMKLAIEYHKVKIDDTWHDDFEAPHAHFIIYSNHGLSNRYVKVINTVLREYYGRSQFFRATQLKATSWEQYMNKDFKRLNEQLNIPHFYEMYIEKTYCDLDWDSNLDFFEDYDPDMNYE